MSDNGKSNHKQLRGIYDKSCGAVFGPYDERTLRILTKTVARMIYPNDEKRYVRSLWEQDRQEPERGYLLCSSDSNSERNSEKKGLIAGLIYKIRCDHYRFGKKRSLNVLMYAYEKGWFDPWKISGWPIGSVRKYHTHYASVAHLYASDYALQSCLPIIYKDIPKTIFAHQFNAIYFQPSFFFSVADFYADLGAKSGIIKSKKNDLWMPSGWKSLTKGCPPLEIQNEESFLQELAEFDNYEKQYRDERRWEYDQPAPKE